MRSIEGKGNATIQPLHVCALTAALAFGTMSCNLYFGEAVPDKEECKEAASENFGGGSFPLDVGTVQAEKAPPPISGGTMALTPEETKAVVADADRDEVYVVDLSTGTLVVTIPLQEGDEPGRVAVDSANRAFIALRSGGAVAVVDVDQGTLVARHALCPAPRGVAIDETRGELFVACNGGELIRADASTGEVLAQTQHDVGLRDVVLEGDAVYVTVLRTAELLVLNREGQEQSRMRPPVLETVTFDEDGERDVLFEPGVAWRTVANPGGGVVMLHQRARKGRVSVGRGGYGGGFGCGAEGVVHGAITVLQPGVDSQVNAALSGAVLPVDLALVSGGQESIVVAPGNGTGDVEFAPPILRVPTENEHRPFDCSFSQEFLFSTGQPVSVEAMSNNRIAVQQREPAALLIFTLDDPFLDPQTVSLSLTSRKDSGHAIFHVNSGSGIACASCHPEGGDDARVWEFDCIGPRRTQALQFGLLGTEPFHWDGDMNDLSTLMDEVFVGRMGGGQPSPTQLDIMAEWLDKVKAPPRSLPNDMSKVERGSQLFFSAAVGCADCHNGPKLTDNKSYDVGTGGKFQVPSLINIANRAPFIHTGCANTLEERFSNQKCGGGDKHGVTSKLTPAEIDDLVAFLKTL